MVQPNSPRGTKKQLDRETYARLKAEIASPYRGLRRFFYFASAGSGFIGAFIFLTQILAGRDIETALSNLAVQAAVIAVAAFLWQWEQRQEDKGKKKK
jgi:Low psii accumulation1 / Rep27